jgi:hypothetical protein
VLFPLTLPSPLLSSVPQEIFGVLRILRIAASIRNLNPKLNPLPLPKP